MGDSSTPRRQGEIRRFGRFSRDDLLPFVALVRIELVRTLRLTRTVVFLSLFLVAASVAALLYWPTYESTWSDAGIAARGFLAAMSVVLMVGAALSIPALAGNCIVQERERRTLDLLATTHATPAMFVFAKLINSVGFAAILCISMAPILVLSSFLVGVNPWTPLMVVSIVMTTSMATAALGIWASLRSRRSATAVAYSYGFMLVVQGAPALLFLLLKGLLRVKVGNAESLVVYTVFALSPMAALSDSINGFFGATVALHPLFAAVIIHFCITVIAIYASIRRTEKLWSGDASSLIVPMPPKRQRGRLKVSSTFYQALNPVMLKDLRFTLGLTGRNGIRIVSYTFLICASATAILLYLKVTGDRANFSRGVEGWMLLRAMVIPLIVVVFCVPLVNSEETDRSLDALRSTLLTSAEILRGKLLAMSTVSGAFVLATLAADLPHLSVRIFSGHEGIMLLTGAGTLITCMLVAMGTSLAVAVFVSNRNTALAVSMIAVFCLLIGNYWLVHFLIYPLLDIYPAYTRGVADWDFACSPIMALFNQMDSVRYNRTHFRIWTTTMLLYSGISAALIAIAFRGYRKRMP